MHLCGAYNHSNWLSAAFSSWQQARRKACVLCAPVSGQRRHCVTCRAIRHPPRARFGRSQSQHTSKCACQGTQTGRGEESVNVAESVRWPEILRSKSWTSARECVTTHSSGTTVSRWDQLATGCMLSEAPEIQVPARLSQARGST